MLRRRPHPGSARRRQPLWSGPLTSLLAGRIPESSRPAALTAIRAFHTAIFASVAAAVLLALWDGARCRPRARTGIAGATVAVESAIYLSNNQVCPLTPLAERLGADNGAVADLFLPAPVARLIPLIAGSAAVVALVLNLRAIDRGRRGAGTR
jgi:hypothetical protein